MTTLATTTELSMGTMKELESLDVKNSFVTVAVDSNRINSTFEAILGALQDVRVVVSNVCAVVETNKKDIGELQTGLTDLTKKWEEDPRFEALWDDQKRQDLQIAALEGSLAQLQAKMDRMEQRVASQESKKVDLTPLEKQIKALRSDVTDLQGGMEKISSTSKEHTKRLDKVGGELDKIRKEADVTSEKLLALYTIFEMNEQTVLALANDPSQHKRRESTGCSGLTDYVLSLPSFQFLYSKLNNAILDLEKSTAEGLAAQKKKLAEEVAFLRTRLSEKLDEKLFLPIRGELDALLRRIAALEPRVDKCVDDLETKATIVSVQKMYDHLDDIKANKGDLVGFLKREDLHPLERDIAALGEALDALGAKHKLEMREIKQQPAAAAAPLLPEIRRSSDVGPLIARVVVVEKDVEVLKTDKLGKDALSDVYMYLDNCLAKLQRELQQTPISPPGMTPEDMGPPSRPTSAGRPTSAKRLQPLMRPPSAGRTRGDDATTPTIPETTRAPSPPITYTSSPAKYVPNNAKWRPTASLYDSDGNRTLATVTAAHVPSLEHWQNVARVASGEEIIPDGMRRHSME